MSGGWVDISPLVSGHLLQGTDRGPVCVACGWVLHNLLTVPVCLGPCPDRFHRMLGSDVAVDLLELLALPERCPTCGSPVPDGADA